MPPNRPPVRFGSDGTRASSMVMVGTPYRADRTDPLTAQAIQYMAEQPLTPQEPDSPLPLWVQVERFAQQVWDVVTQPRGRSAESVPRREYSSADEALLRRQAEVLAGDFASINRLPEPGFFDLSLVREPLDPSALALRPGHVYRASDPEYVGELPVRDTLGIASLQAPLQVSQVTPRPYSVPDEATLRHAAEVQAEEDRRVFDALDRLSQEGFSANPRAEPGFMEASFVFNPRRLMVPDFEFVENPTIRLDDIQQRRFSMIDRYRYPQSPTHAYATRVWEACVAQSRQEQASG